MSLPVESLNIYKYKISKLTLLSPTWDKPKTIEGSYITSLSINNDYENTIAPQVMVSIQAQYSVYYEILAAAKSLTAMFTINITSTGSNKDNTDTNNQSMTYSTEWLSISMKATDQGYLFSKDVSENSRDKSTTDQESNEDLKKDKLPINLYLYDATKLIKYRKNKSFIISGNKNDVIYQMFTKRDMDSILVSAADDDLVNTYAIPYGDLGQNLKDLDNNYGIYNYNYLFYMGLDRTYLINKGNIGKDLEQNELASVNIYVENYDSNDAANIYNGCYKDETNNVYVIGSSDISIDNIDTLQDFSVGGKITTTVAGSGIMYSDIVGDYEVEKSFLLPNSKKRNQLIHSMTESKRCLYVNVNNIDVSIITPNKKYTVIANTKYYDDDYDISGTYRLINANIAFATVGNNTFETVTSLALVKVPEL